MPWSNQSGGGGPWGQRGGSGGGKSPWGSGARRATGPTRSRRYPPPQSGSPEEPSCPAARWAAKGLSRFFLAPSSIWLLTGFYTVRPNEVGINMIFGKYTGTTGEGLRYNLPYPIGRVIKPNVTEQQRIEVGYRSSANAQQRSRDVIEESLMLTGDENIVDIDFDAVWQVNAARAQDFVFNLQNPEGTIKAVAESAMREVIGRRNIQAVSDDRAGQRGAGSAADHAADAGRLRRRCSHQRRADAGRAAARGCEAGLLRRQRRPAGRRSRAERGGDLCKPGRARSPRRGLADHPAGRRLSRAIGCRRVRSGRPFPEGLRGVSAKLRPSAASGSSSRPWSASTAGSTRSSSIRSAPERRALPSS